MTDDYRARARRRAKERRQSIWYKLEQGDNTFRILLTPVEDGEDPWLEYAIHRNVGSKKVTVRCGKKLPRHKGFCWLCDVKAKALKKAGKTKRAKDLLPQDVFLIQVASVSRSGRMTGPFLFTPSKTVADQLLSSVIGSDRKRYLDHKRGYNLTLNRVGTGRNDTRYGMLQPDDDPSRVDKDILEKLKPFSELKEIPVYDEDRQKAAYSGQDYREEDHMKSKKKKRDEEEEIEDDEEETEDSEEEDEESEESEEEDEEEEDEEDLPPKKKKGKKSASKKSKEDDDEDDESEESEEEDEEEEDEEEEEEPSKKKKKVKPSKKSKKSKEDDDEDEEDSEEEDEEEEEEEEPPKKKKKKSKKDDDEDEEEEEEDESDDEEDEAPPKKKGKKGKKSKKDDDDELDELDELDEESEEDEEEEEEPPKNKKKKSKK